MKGTMYWGIYLVEGKINTVAYSINKSFNDISGDWGEFHLFTPEEVFTLQSMVKELEIWYGDDITRIEKDSIDRSLKRKVYGERF